MLSGSKQVNPKAGIKEFYLQAEKELQENDKDGVGPEPTIL